MAENGRVYYVSDDGYLYCVDAKKGNLVWRFRGAPGNRKVIGNERVISAWPARGGPVIRDGVLYFAASIWPFMGTFIYALDAETGDIKWVNDGTSAQYIKQPHNAPSFAGVAPQGAFVATQDHLIIPGGRSVPAVFERATGDFKYFHLAAGGKGNGGSFVAANEQHFFLHTRRQGVRAYELETGEQTSFLFNEPVLDGEHLYASSDIFLREARKVEYQSQNKSAKRTKSRAEAALKKLTAPKDAPETEAETTDRQNKIAAENKRITEAEKQIADLVPLLAKAEADWREEWKGHLIQGFNTKQELLWELEADASGDLIKAGNRLYGAGQTKLTAYDLGQNGEVPTESWSHAVDGTVQRLLAANGMLFAVTLEGTILAFADQEPITNKPNEPTVSDLLPNEPWPIYEVMAGSLDSKAGYALVYGTADRRGLDFLLRETDFHVVAV